MPSSNSEVLVRMVLDASPRTLAGFERALLDEASAFTRLRMVRLLAIRSFRARALLEGVEHPLIDAAIDELYQALAGLSANDAHRGSVVAALRHLQAESARMYTERAEQAARVRVGDVDRLIERATDALHGH